MAQRGGGGGGGRGGGGGGRGGGRGKRKSLSDELASSRAVVFKAELDSPYNFRWPVLGAADSKEALLRMQRDPALAQLIGARQAAAESAAATRGRETQKRQRLSADGGDEVQGQRPSADARKDARRARARQRAEATDSAGDSADAAAVLGLNAVGRALERGELCAVVVCREAGGAGLTAHVPALCHRHGTALCALHQSVSTAQLGAAVGLKRCAAIGFRGGDEEDGVVAWLGQRSAAPAISWLERRR
jgi:ribosomal protein L7Ae-like RNA K-turn-binding protein